MRKIAILLMLIFVTLIVGCGKSKKESEGEKTESQQKRLEIVTTTGMIADIVKNIGDDFVDVTALMGPGVDPHLYKASEDDIKRMTNADVIFYNGLHLEGAMAELLERMSGSVRTLAVSSKIDTSLLIRSEQFEGSFDPHIWFDVRLWMSAVQYVRDILMEMDPDHSEVYYFNTEGYSIDLSDLHDYVYKTARSIPPPQRVLITAHNAFSYFGRAYGFEVRGLQGISTATEEGTAGVQNLAQFIAERKIAAIFAETSVPSRSIEAVKAAAVAKGFDVKIGETLYSDAMGSIGTPVGTYVGMIRHNIDTMADALMGGRSPQMP